MTSSDTTVPHVHVPSLAPIPRAVLLTWASLLVLLALSSLDLLARQDVFLH